MALAVGIAASLLLFSMNLLDLKLGQFLRKRRMNRPLSFLHDLLKVLINATILTNVMSLNLFNLASKSDNETLIILLVEVVSLLLLLVSWTLMRTRYNRMLITSLTTPNSLMNNVYLLIIGLTKVLQMREEMQFSQSDISRQNLVFEKGGFLIYFLEMAIVQSRESIFFLAIMAKNLFLFYIHSGYLIMATKSSYSNDLWKGIFGGEINEPIQRGNTAVVALNHTCRVVVRIFGGCNYFGLWTEKRIWLRAVTIVSTLLLMLHQSIFILFSRYLKRDPALSEYMKYNLFHLYYVPINNNLQLTIHSLVNDMIWIKNRGMILNSSLKFLLTTLLMQVALNSILYPRAFDGYKETLFIIFIQKIRVLLAIVFLTGFVSRRCIDVILKSFSDAMKLLAANFILSVVESNQGFMINIFFTLVMNIIGVGFICFKNLEQIKSNM